MRELQEQMADLPEADCQVALDEVVKRWELNCPAGTPGRMVVLYLLMVGEVSRITKILEETDDRLVCVVEHVGGTTDGETKRMTLTCSDSHVSLVPSPLET